MVQLRISVVFTSQALYRVSALEFLQLLRRDLVDELPNRHRTAVSLDHDIVPRGRDVDEARAEDVGALALAHERELKLSLVRVGVEILAQLGVDGVGLIGHVDVEASCHIPHIRLQRLNLVVVVAHRL